MIKNIFLSLSIPEILEKIKNNKIDFYDLISETEKAISSYETNCLAWVCYDYDYLRSESKLAYSNYQKRGYLLEMDGIPFGVKDIFNTKHFPTQMGSSLWDGFMPGNNARVVDSLLLKGGLVAGKTITAEFAVHKLNETINPHYKDRTPGTSSSGSAVAVATGMVPFALATQTAGSIIRPASFCGIWGMKPSFGMIPRTGVLKTTDSLDSIGFVSAHAKSLRQILDVVRVKGPDYPFVYKNIDRKLSSPVVSSDRKWRVGLIKTHTWNGATEYARNAIESLAKKIGGEKNFEIREIEWPSQLNSAHEIHETIYNKSLSYYFQNESRQSSSISQIMKEMIDAGLSIDVAMYLSALRKQEIFCSELDDLMSTCDFALTLGTSSSAPMRGNLELPDPSLIWTLGHLPAVASPVFRCPEGMPFAAQFISRRWGDYLLLDGIEALVDRGVLPSGSQPINLKNSN